MKNDFLDIAQTILDEIKSTTYKRVDEDILWVGATDEELNRVVDLTFCNSLRIQIGTAMNYFDDEEAKEEEVLEQFIKILLTEITEIRFCKGDKVLETKFQIVDFDGVEDVGISSSLRNLINKADREVIIKHNPVLSNEQYNQLKQELKRVYNNM